MNQVTEISSPNEYIGVSQRDDLKYGFVLVALLLFYFNQQLEEFLSS